jgi:hypothetical protein
MRGGDAAAAAKALYCAAGLARNSAAGASALLRSGGLEAAAALLQQAPGASPQPAALRRKALSLLADLAHADAQARPHALLRPAASAPGRTSSYRASAPRRACDASRAQGLAAHVDALGGAAALAAALPAQLSAAATGADWDTAERALLALRALAAVPPLAARLRVRPQPGRLFSLLQPAERRCHFL